jgi:hypothetical protein
VGVDAVLLKYPAGGFKEIGSKATTSDKSGRMKLTVATKLEGMKITTIKK